MGRGRKKRIEAKIRPIVTKNIRRFLQAEESRWSKQAESLAEHLGATPNTARNLRADGTDSIATLEQISAYANVHVKEMFVDRPDEYMLVSGVQRIAEDRYAVKMWIDELPSTFLLLNDLCAWEEAGEWQLGTYAHAPRVPLHAVHDYIPALKPMARSQFTIGLHSRDKQYISGVARGLADHGFETWVASSAAEANRLALEQPPGIMVIDGAEPPDFLADIRGRVPYRVPAIMLVHAPSPADPTTLSYFALRGDGTEVIVAVRSMVYFSKSIRR